MRHILNTLIKSTNRSPIPQSSWANVSARARASLHARSIKEQLRLRSAFFVFISILTVSSELKRFSGTEPQRRRERLPHHRARSFPHQNRDLPRASAFKLWSILTCVDSTLCPLFCEQCAFGGCGRVDKQKMMILSGLLFPALWGLALGGSPSVQIGERTSPVYAFRSQESRLHTSDNRNYAINVFFMCLPCEIFDIKRYNASILE